MCGLLWIECLCPLPSKSIADLMAKVVVLASGWACGR